MGGACGPYGEKRNAYKALKGKSESNRPLGKRRYMLEDNMMVVKK
jgi:hypothetical protein